MSAIDLSRSGSAPTAQGVDIQAYVDVFRRRKLVFGAAFAVVLGAGAVNTLLAKPTYEAKVVFALPDTRQGIGITALSAVAPEGLKGGVADPATVDEQLQSIQGGATLIEALKAAHIRPRPGVAPPEVTAKNAQGTRFISVTVQGGSANEVADLANAIPPAHTRALHTARADDLREEMDHLRTDQEKAQDRLKTADRALLAYRAAHPVSDLVAARESNAKESQDLQARMRSAQVTLSSIQAQLGVVRGRLAQEPRTVTQHTTLPNPRVVPVRARLEELQAQREKLLLDFLQESDEVKAVDQQISKVNEQLSGLPETITQDSQVDNPKRFALEARLTDLEASLEASQAEIRTLRSAPQPAAGVSNAQMGQWELEEAKLADDRKAALTVLTAITRRQQMMKAAVEEPPPPPAEFSEARVPHFPVAPDRKKDLAFAFVLAIVVATGVVFLLDFLDDRAHSPADVDRVTHLPALGHVPAMEPLGGLTLASLPENSAASECYRLVRSNIAFASLERSVRRVLVTSSTHHEGKTTTAVNLAIAMALDGKRVVLVDTDLRRPRIDRVLNVPREPGLLQVVTGELSLDAALKPSSTPNLQVLTAGGVPSSPAELLGSPAFAALLEELDQRADVVVFDSPPCIPVVDPLILASQVDGVILVIRAGHTKLPDIKSAEEALGRARARILGLVYNRVQANGSYYYKRYSYDSNGSGKTNGHSAQSNGRALELEPLATGAVRSSGLSEQ